MSISNKKPVFWIGILVIAAGLLPVIIGAEPSKGIPYWMIPMSCSVFVLAGLSLCSQSLGLSWLSKIIGPLILLIFGFLATWIGFGPGERECSSSASFLFFTKKQSSGCQVFGFSGIFIFLIFLFYLKQTFKKKKS